MGDNAVFWRKFQLKWLFHFLSRELKSPNLVYRKVTEQQPRLWSVAQEIACLGPILLPLKGKEVLFCFSTENKRKNGKVSLRAEDAQLVEHWPSTHAPGLWITALQKQAGAQSENQQVWLLLTQVPCGDKHVRSLSCCLWWHTLVILSLGRQRHKESHEFETSQIKTTTKRFTKMNYFLHSKEFSRASEMA